jgi:hypothetical protein
MYLRVNRVIAKLIQKQNYGLITKERKTVNLHFLSRSELIQNIAAESKMAMKSVMMMLPTGRRW